MLQMCASAHTHTLLSLLVFALLNEACRILTGQRWKQKVETQLFCVCRLVCGELGLLRGKQPEVFTVPTPDSNILLLS